MFERRFAPLYLALCAVTLVAVWTAVAPGAAAVSTLGWMLAGMFALYGVAMLIDRATRSPQSVAHGLEEATQVNAARMAAPRPTSAADLDDPRR